MNQENALPRRKAMLYYPSQPKPRPVRLREKDRDPYDGLRPWSAITHGIGAAPVSYTHLDVYKRQAVISLVRHRIKICAGKVGLIAPL